MLRRSIHPLFVSLKEKDVNNLRCNRRYATLLSPPAPKVPDITYAVMVFNILNDHAPAIRTLLFNPEAIGTVRLRDNNLIKNIMIVRGVLNKSKIKSQKLINIPPLHSK